MRIFGKKKRLPGNRFLLQLKLHLKKLVKKLHLVHLNSIIQAQKVQPEFVLIESFLNIGFVDANN